MLVRDRISDQLARASRRSVTVLLAPEGYGKSVALTHYLEALRPHFEALPGAIVRYDVCELDDSPARFLRGLATSLEPWIPGVAQSLAMAYERAVDAPDFSEAVGTWLGEHLRGQPRLIVVDDFHYSAGGPIAKLLASAIEHTWDWVHWIVAVRSIGELPLAAWLASGRTELPIDEEALRLTSDDARQLATSVSTTLDADTVDRVLAATHAEPAAFAFALKTVAARPRLADGLPERDETLVRRCLDDALKLLPAADVAFLVETAALPDLEESTLVCTGIPDALHTLAKLRRRTPHVFAQARRRHAYQGLVRRVLRDRIDALETQARHAVLARAGGALEAAGRTAEALAFFLKHANVDASARMLEEHGLALLESGRGEGLVDVVDRLAKPEHGGGAVAHAVKAVTESRRGRYAPAETSFRSALDGDADPLVRGRIVYHYASHLLRFFRPDVATVLERLAKDTKISSELRAYALAASGPALVLERRLKDAEACVQAALALAATTQNQHLIAKAHHQASYVALYAGDAARAKAFATRSLEEATRNGYFDIAGGALSVLYNVAADIEDDPEQSLRLLSAMGEVAAKSANPTDRVLSVGAALEIEVERGDEAAAARLDAEFGRLDASCDARAAFEIVPPTRALQASWQGDFATAYDLVAGTADQQWSCDRKALRLAEIAVYAAAASRREDASHAVRETLDALSEAREAGLRIQRARLFLALAMILLGEHQGARHLLDLFDDVSGPQSARLRGLRRVLGTLQSRYLGEHNNGDVLAQIEELKSNHFGGIARLLMALPLPSDSLYAFPEFLRHRSDWGRDEDDRHAPPTVLPSVLAAYGSVRSDDVDALKADLRRLEPNRRHLIRSIVTAGVAAERQTLAVGIVAQAFLERLFDALERRSYLQLLSWIDRTCDAFHESPQIGSMLGSACRAIASATRDGGLASSALLNELTFLENSVFSVAFRPRRRRPPNAPPGLDEVDREIAALLARLATADPTASEHCRAVSQWCARIGEGLSLSTAEIAFVSRCGLLHDVGKMHTLPETLRVRRPLTAPEWEAVRAHALVGEQIVGKIKPLRQFAPCVRSHHERLDGGGYPDGLTGSELPIATRIVGVADAFNAMIAYRPYREAISPRDALAELRKNRGTRFDPIVVEALVETLGRTDWMN